MAKVTDFGIAKGEEDAKAGRGVTRGIIGSLSYMAPEQVRGQRDLENESTSTRWAFCSTSCSWGGSRSKRPATTS